MSRRLVAFGVMLASGFAGLGYQIVWTQQSALWLGHEAAAVLAVVTAFFGGLALGALLLGGRIDRSHHPARWYAGCELLIAAWSLLLAYTMAPAGFALATLAGPEPGPWVQGAIALGGSFLLFLPATVSMGATLPAMARLLDQTAARRGSLGELYAANTFGAVVGVLATAFWLVPAIGLAATASWCAALNIGCAAGALLMTRRNEPVPPLAISPPSSRRILWLLSATGLLGIGYEVLVVRVISQLAENTVYTFAVLLAVYLLGTAGGAAIQSQQARRDTVGADAISERLLLALAVACSVGAAALWGGPSIRNAVLGLPLARSVVLGVTAEAAMALAAFALPTVVMGALFSHLCTQAREQGRGFGVALGVNTLGAAAAPLVFGVMLLPALGAMVALGIVVCGYLALGFWTARRALPGRLIRVASVAVAGVAALTLLPALRFVDLPEGGRLLDYTEGPTAAVSVVESAEGVRVLRVDNRQQEGSSATAFVDARQAL
ncbi:MAG: spermidine synthase, partial [Rubrivivax sp.]